MGLLAGEAGKEDCVKQVLREKNHGTYMGGDMKKGSAAEKD